MEVELEINEEEEEREILDRAWEAMLQVRLSGICTRTFSDKLFPWE